jgi:hypothetical protein
MNCDRNIHPRMAILLSDWKVYFQSGKFNTFSPTGGNQRESHDRNFQVGFFLWLQVPLVFRQMVAARKTSRYSSSTQATTTDTQAPAGPAYSSAFPRNFIVLAFLSLLEEFIIVLSLGHVLVGSVRHRDDKYYYYQTRSLTVPKS